MNAVLTRGVGKGKVGVLATCYAVQSLVVRKVTLQAPLEAE
jgi:hypothetical protein